VHVVTDMTLGCSWRLMLHRYITSLYWSITTMCTVGFGDVVPISIPEKIVGMVTMILGARCVMLQIPVPVTCDDLAPAWSRTCASISLLQPAIMSRCFGD
jgi:hypothetical protein